MCKWKTIKRVTIFTIALALGFVFSFDMPGGESFLGTSVKAQQIKKARKRRKSFFERLFGGPNRAKSSRKNRVRSRKKRRRKRRSGSRLVKAIPAVEKSENAQTVLVVGDFFAKGLAKGLVIAFNQSPNVRIASQTSGSSGLVRPDYFDWTGKISSIIEETKPAVVVVMLGTNDRQMMKLEGQKLKFRTPEWDDAYKAKAEGFAKAVRGNNRPLIWMGLPPVKFSKMNTDLLFFNEVYKSRVEKFGGRFIDVWDGYTNAEGNFSRSGPDINGQIVRLRTSDGINVTKAGRRKLAFYLERVLGKYVDGSTSILASLPDAQGDLPGNNAPFVDPRITGKTGIIHLSDPTLDGVDVLAGALPIKGENSQLISSDLGSQLAKTRQNLNVPRVDNYRWPRGSAAPVRSTGAK